VLLCLQGGGEDLEAAGVGDLDAAASGGFCVGTGERNNLGYTGVASYQRCVAQAQPCRCYITLELYHSTFPPDVLCQHLRWAAAY
jgi:hypothetical protein